MKVLWYRNPAAAPPVRGAGDVNDYNDGDEEEEEEKDKENEEDLKPAQ